MLVHSCLNVLDSLDTRFPAAETEAAEQKTVPHQPLVCNDFVPNASERDF